MRGKSRGCLSPPHDSQAANLSVADMRRASLSTCSNDIDGLSRLSPTGFDVVTVAGWIGPKNLQTYCQSRFARDEADGRGFAVANDVHLRSCGGDDGGDAVMLGRRVVELEAAVEPSARQGSLHSFDAQPQASVQIAEQPVHSGGAS